MGVKNWEFLRVRDEISGDYDSHVYTWSDTTLILNMTPLGEPNNCIHFEFKRRDQQTGELVSTGTNTINYLYRKVLSRERQTGDDIVTEDGIKWRLIYSGNGGTFEYNYYDFWYPQTSTSDTQAIDEFVEFMFKNNTYSGISMASAVMSGIQPECVAIERAKSWVNSDGIGTCAVQTTNYVYIACYATNNANLYLPYSSRQLRMTYSAFSYGDSSWNYSDFTINPGWTVNFNDFDFFDVLGKVAIFAISKQQYNSILSGYAPNYYNFWGCAYQNNNYVQKIGWQYGTPALKTTQ